MFYYLGSHNWLWGGGGCEAFQMVPTPCGSSTRGGAEGDKRTNLHPSGLLCGHATVRHALPLASATAAALTALLAFASASHTALASFRRPNVQGSSLRTGLALSEMSLRAHLTVEIDVT